MAAIVTVNDQRIQLGAEEIVHPMGIGVNWTKIRIGVLFAVNGVNTFKNGNLLIGVCQGGIPYNSPNCIEFVGATISTYPASTWSYTVSTKAYSPAFNPPAMIYKKGTSVTTTLSGSSDNSSCWAVGSGNKTAHFVELTKDVSRTQVTFKNYYVNANGTPTITWDFNRFLQDLENENAVTGIQTGSTGTITPAGSSFAWDAVDIYWNKSTPTIEIMGYAVVRFY